MESLKTLIDEICDCTSVLGNSKLISIAKFLRQRIYQPDSYLVFLGESCSGKSTLINKIIGDDLLPVSGVPSTGAVTEVFFDGTTDKKGYYVINKNATMEVLSQTEFEKLAIEPDLNVERLRVTVPVERGNMAGVRLFDTPGYGSLTKEHDEVLTEFLPNCDAVVYTVSYRMGIQEDDYLFLQQLTELVRYGIPMCLMINRCPEGVLHTDKRVKEICQYVSAYLENKDIPVFLINSFSDENQTLVEEQMKSAWKQISQELNSEVRKEELKSAYKNYLRELILRIRTEIERRVRNAEMDQKEQEEFSRNIEELIERLNTAEQCVIVPGFNKIKSQFPKCVNQSAKNIESQVCQEIERQSNFSEDETGAYIRQHLLKYYTQKEVKELQFFIAQELDAIDKEVNDYLNKAIVQFESDIKVRGNSNVESACANVVKGVAERLANTGLLNYFAQYGGAAGSGAGVANAASHTLKKVGDIFGKTFSRETHNSIKHIMAKIGLTSSKAIAAAGAAIIEVASMLYGLATWKAKLCKEVKKSILKWEEDVTGLVLTDLKKLEDENISNIKQYVEDLCEYTKSEIRTDENLDMLNKQLLFIEEAERKVS